MNDRLFDWTDPDIPHVASKQWDQYHWQIVCPFCEKKHLHSAGEGTRMPHCDKSQMELVTQYYIDPPKAS
jgi:hypothetical protein